MKVKTIIDIDTESGDYEVEYRIEPKSEKIEQEKLVKILHRVLENWAMKFVN